MGKPSTTILYHIIIRPALNIFWKHYIYYKKDTKVSGQNFCYQILFCTRLLSIRLQDVLLRICGAWINDHTNYVKRDVINYTPLPYVGAVTPPHSNPDKLILVSHDDVIEWKHFPRNWPFVRGIHRPRWIPHTKASDAELWCFLWSTSE